MTTLSSMEDRVLELMVNEGESLFIGEIVAVLELDRFSVAKTLDSLIKKNLVYFNKKKGVYGIL